MIKKVTIFDLDGTVIDSSHRQAYDLKTGNLDLANWIANSTPEKVANDSLLPLAEYWHQLLREANDYIMVCTARVLSAPDYKFLNRYGLFAHKIISRPIGVQTGDAQLKLQQLRPFKNLKQFQDVDFEMFDDNESVRKIVRTIGIKAINPLSIQRV